MSHLGYFGKTPHRGDFVRFNLPQSFIKVWDDWLQQIMINGEALGNAWSERYAIAPAYRFALSSGIAGSTPWIGVLRTSQDKVGRRFPFCIVMSLPESALPCLSVINQCEFLEEADILMNRVLASDFNFDELQGELALMADKHRQPDSELNKLQTPTSKPFGDAMTISMTSSSNLYGSSAIPALLDTVLQQTLGEYSLWIASGSIETTVINSGLPVDSAGLALINSNWDQASTAIVDLTAITSDQTRVEQKPASIEAGIGTHEPDATAELMPLEEHQGDDSQSPADQPSELKLTDNESIETAKPTAIPSSTETRTEQHPSPDDWAALDDITSAVEPNEVVFVPKVEPLELEEDDVDTAPWEN